jgi:hypothetical protein
MKALTAVAAALTLAGLLATAARPGTGWAPGPTGTEKVVSSPVTGGGYPVPAGST